MIFVLICILILLLWGIKYNKNGWDDYLGKDQTTCIKGIFILIIFLSHFNSYTAGVLNSGTLNNIYIRVFYYISQLMVVPFLLYSGYSICYSIDNKKDYIKKFPKNRILKVLLQFDLAVLMYLIMNMILHNTYSIKTIILSFTGWHSIGNSNWFVFSLICLYVISYIVFKIKKSKVNWESLLLISLATVILILVLRIKKESYWYDILLSYPFGMFIYIYRDKVLAILKKYYYLILVGVIVLFIIGHMYTSNIFVYELLACLFGFILLVITNRFKIKNKVLMFIGNLSFEIYILQRIPDIILQKYIPDNPVLFCIICFILTIIISYVFNEIYKRISKYLFV